jgi:hypothetical protein
MRSKSRILYKQRGLRLEASLAGGPPYKKKGVNDGKKKHKKLRE